MGVGLIITVISLLLLLYWFGYSCALILAAKGARDYSPHVTTANGLAFPSISRKLAEAPSAESDLERYNTALQRDYRIVTSLLATAEDYRANGEAAEQRMLHLFYRVLRVRYVIFRGISIRYSASALAQMCEVVGYFANVAGEAVYCGR
jgi:hypothetical protein